MVPLVANQRMMSWLRLYPDEETSSNTQKVARIVFSVINLTIILSGGVSSFIYFIEFMSIDLERSLFAILQFLLTSAVLYSHITAFVLRKQIPSLRKNLSKIYRDCKFFVEFHNEIIFGGILLLIY